MIYQGDMITGSNGCIISWIYSLAWPEKRRFIFEMSDKSEKAGGNFSDGEPFVNNGSGVGIIRRLR
jgi:hypothetical protein